MQHAFGSGSECSLRLVSSKWSNRRLNRLYTTPIKKSVGKLRSPPKLSTISPRIRFSAKLLQPQAFPRLACATKAAKNSFCLVRYDDAFSKFRHHIVDSRTCEAVQKPRNAVPLYLHTTTRSSSCSGKENTLRAGGYQRVRFAVEGSPPHFAPVVIGVFTGLARSRIGPFCNSNLRCGCYFFTGTSARVIGLASSSG